MIVSGVGFTPSATITFMCGNEMIQTVPGPLVADSSGGFTALLMTGKLGEGSCTITATDGANTAQATITVNDHDHDQKPPRRCSVTGNSLDTACCGTFAHSADGVCCGLNEHGLDIPSCGRPAPPTLN